jgi:GNAT superfamily N-acetyltransferase
MEWKREAYRIVDGPLAVDADAVFRLLAGTHWANRRPREIIQKLIENSLCFSLFLGNEQVGFARVATDYTVFSWLSDLVIADAHRKQGLGEWLLRCVVEHPAIARTQFVLQTSSAHALYERFGFQESAKLMTRLPPGTQRSAP